MRQGRIGRLPTSKEAASMDFHQTAHGSHSKLLFVISKKRAPHPDPLAEYAANLFRISRSSIVHFS